MTNADEDLVTIAVRWPGDETPEEPGVTYVNASDVQVTGRVLRNFGPYRQRQIVVTDLVTAVRWVEAHLFDVAHDEAYERLRTAAAEAVGKGGTDGDEKVTGAGESRPRASRRRRRDDGADGRNHAGDTEPVQGSDAGGRGDSAG